MPEFLGAEMVKNPSRVDRRDRDDDDVDALLEAEFGPAQTSGSMFGPAETGISRPADTGVPGGAGTTDAFDRVDTAKHTLRATSPTTSSPVLCDLTYESRMEANLYVSRTLIAETRCRIAVDGLVVAIERGARGFSAYDGDGARIAVASEVPLLLIELLERYRG